MTMKEIKEKLFLAIEFSFSAVLLVIILLLSIRLTAESDRVTELEREYKQLSVKNEILCAEYENTICLEDIERYATEILGMQRCNSSQIIYVDMQSEG